MEERKGKNCKIIQEFCLWGTATQFVGAGDGSPCQRTSSWTYSGIYQMFYQKSFNIHRLTYLTRLRLTTGVSTVSVTQCMHSYPPRRRASCGVAPGLCSPQPVAKPLHATCQLKAPQITQREEKPKWEGKPEEACRGFRHRAKRKSPLSDFSSLARESHTQLKRND